MSLALRKKTGKIKRTAEILRRELQHSQLRHGTRYASARETAERFSISIPTAHEVLNCLVEDKLLYRVRGSGTFINSDPGGKVYQIALLDTPATPVPQSLYDVFAARITRMTGELQAHNCRVKVIPYYELRESSAALKLLRSFDGLLIANTYLDPYSEKIFKACGVPLVVFGHFYELPAAFSQVFGNMLPGMNEALAEIPASVLEKAVIFTENPKLALLWKQALAERGINTENIEVVSIDLNKRSLECYKNVRVHFKHLAQRLILTTTDGLAYNIIDAFMLEGLRPGRDFHLISCGDREGLGFRFSEDPMISSVGISEQLVTAEAIRILLHQIKNPSDVIYQARIPSYFAVRKSFTGQSVLLMSKTRR